MPIPRPAGRRLSRGCGRAACREVARLADTVRSGNYPAHAQTAPAGPGRAAASRAERGACHGGPSSPARYPGRPPASGAPPARACGRPPATWRHNAGHAAFSPRGLRAACSNRARLGDGSHVTADRIARAQQIPGKFLETILTQLRRAGLIRSQRGPEGGFWLARPAEEISLADIIRAIDGPLLGVRGERPENIEYPGAAEPLQQVWIALRANERAILEEVTLGHIVARSCPSAYGRSPRTPRPGSKPLVPAAAEPTAGRRKT